MIIVGAGLAGLIAGHLFPRAKIIERSPEPTVTHRALLRFRSDAVSLVTGIPFRRVRVHKGILSRGQLVQPSIALANSYSLKVTGRFTDRSIWNLEPSDRWIAPDTLHEQLWQSLGSRIEWGTALGTEFARAMRSSSEQPPVVSTIPLIDAASMWLRSAPPDITFERAPILVQRWQVEDVSLYQTIYVPCLSTSTYRLSITGNTLIAESMATDGEESVMTLEDTLCAFGIPMSAVGVKELGAVKQHYGKIAPIEELARRELVHKLTAEAGVYSLGRFATWRNILLDDVVKDARIIKEMINQNDAYTRRLRSV